MRYEQRTENPCAGEVSSEVRLFITVALAGAFGGVIRAVLLFYVYAGQLIELKDAVRYILSSFVGAALALMIFTVIRGGFFSPNTTVQSVNIHACIGLAFVVGMFWENALKKLKEIAENTLSKTQIGDEAPSEK